MQNPSNMLAGRVRAFVNSRFQSINQRLDHLEETNARLERTIHETLDLVRSDVADAREIERAILDSLIFLGESVASNAAEVAVPPEAGEMESR